MNDAETVIRYLSTIPRCWQDAEFSAAMESAKRLAGKPKPRRIKKPATHKHDMGKIRRAIVLNESLADVVESFDINAHVSHFEFVRMLKTACERLRREFNFDKL